MRGNDENQLDVFSYVNPEQRLPQDHPLRSLRAITDEAIQRLKGRLEVRADHASQRNGSTSAFGHPTSGQGNLRSDTRGRHECGFAQRLKIRLKSEIPNEEASLAKDQI